MLESLSFDTSKFHKLGHSLILYSEPMCPGVKRNSLFRAGPLTIAIIFMTRTKYDCNLDHKRDQM